MSMSTCYHQTLQPMDSAVNKPSQEFLRGEFEQWYLEHVMKQLEGQDIVDMKTAELTPVDLGLTALKQIEAKWLVDMASYIGNNPQFIVNGFIGSGIRGALDVHHNGDQPEQGTGDVDESGHEQETDSQTDSNGSDEDSDNENEACNTDHVHMVVQCCS